MTEIQEAGKIPYLKSDALLEVKIGAAYVQSLQDVLVYLIQGHGDDISALEAKKGQGPYTPWENAIVAITTLLQEIMKVAADTDQMEYKEADEIANEPQDSQ